MKTKIQTKDFEEENIIYLFPNGKHHKVSSPWKEQWTNEDVKLGISKVRWLREDGFLKVFAEILANPVHVLWVNTEMLH